MRARRFVLQRDVDVSGVSGTGVVAEGVQFSDDTAVVRWIAGDHRSTVVWADVASLEAIHGHGGATRIVWLDDENDQGRLRGRVQLVRTPGREPFARVIADNGEEVWRTSETYVDVDDVLRAVEILAELTHGLVPMVDEVPE